MYPGEIIKQKRQKLAMTLEELSQETSFSIGYLSKLERGTSLPPLATLQKVASVLDIDMMQLLNSQEDHVISADKDIELSVRADAEDPKEQYTSRALLKDYKNRAILPLVMHIKPGQTEVFSHDAEEFIYVLEGEVVLNYKGKQHTLKKGDGAYIDSRKPHSFENLSEETASLLTANYIYRRF